MPQPQISDYGFISDCRSGALVGRDGSIDWWCPDRFDSPSVFGRLLDPAAGHWRIAPLAASRVERAYRPDTLVLRTVHHTPEGSVAVTDAFMHMVDKPTGVMGLFMSLTGSAPGLRLGSLFRWAAVADRVAYRTWLLERLAQDPPKILVPGHGEPLSDDGLAFGPEGSSLAELIGRFLAGGAPERVVF